MFDFHGMDRFGLGLSGLRIKNNCLGLRITVGLKGTYCRTESLKHIQNNEMF